MSLNLIVVDDSAVMRAMIIKTLRLSRLPLGAIHECANGRDALAILDANWIDLVLLDINMPEMNGEELLERLRTTPATADLPVVVVSTEGSETRIARLVAMGATFVHKPFTPERLRTEVVRLIGANHGDHGDGSAVQCSGLDF